MEDKNSLQPLSKKSQKQALLISASAGTGKTYTLIRYIYEAIIYKNIKISKMVILTFTEAATVEMRERLRNRLMAGTTADDPLVRKNAREALSALDSAYIYTIHGFCHRINSEFNIGTAASEYARFWGSSDISNMAIARVLRQINKRESLNKDFYKIEYSQFFFTDFLDIDLSRVKRWLTQALQSFNTHSKIIFLTGMHLRKKGEIKIFSRKIISITKKIKIFRETCDKSFLEILPAENMELLWIAMIRGKLLEQRDFNGKELNFAQAMKSLLPNDKTKDFITLEKLWAEYISAFLFLQENDRQKTLEAFALHRLAVYTFFSIPEIEKEQNIYSYDSMVRDLAEGIEQRGGLLKILQNRFSMAFIDEFQDTDIYQWKIFEKIFLENDLANLLIVGDEKQALYSFRGADVSLFMRVRKELEQSGKAQRKILSENFRSTENIISAFNDFFGKFLQDYYEVGSWEKRFPGFETTKHKELSLAEIEARKTHAKNFSKSGGWENELNQIDRKSFNLFLFPNTSISSETLKENVWRKIADEILILMGHEFSGNHSEATTKSKFFICSKTLKKRNLAWNDIAILLRSRSEVEALENQFDSMNIPWEYSGNKNIWESSQAIQIKAILNALLHPGFVYNSMVASLTKAFAIKAHEITDQNFLEIHKLLEKETHRLLFWANNREWGKFFFKLESLFKEGVFLRADPEARLHALEREMAIVQAILHDLHVKALSGSMTLATMHQYMQNVMAGIETNEVSREPKKVSQALKVQVMTIHESKGLEFPVVFVGGTTKGEKSEYPKVKSIFRKLPGNNAQSFSRSQLSKKVFLSMEKSDALPLKDFEYSGEDDELVKLLYVAITRAQYVVYLPLIPKVRSESFLFRVSEIIKPYLSDLKESENIQVIDCTNDFDFSKSNNEHNAHIKARQSDEKGLEKMLNPNKLFMELKIAHRKNTIESFSSLQKMARHYNRAEAVSQGIPERIFMPFDEHESTWEKERLQIGLPGGKNMGSFLHELLEKTSFAQAKTWKQFSDVLDDKNNTTEINNGGNYIFNYQESIVKLLDRYQIFVQKKYQNKNQLDSLITQTAKLLFETMHTPFLPEEGRLCDIDDANALREMSFLANDRSYRTAFKSAPWEGNEGFITGNIDLFFKWKDKFYILDYKSNILENYEPEKIAVSVHKHYSMQAAIYAKAISQYLGSEKNRFQGFYFLYLRGLDRSNPKTGVYYLEDENAK